MGKAYLSSTDMNDIACIYAALSKDFQVEDRAARERLAKAIVQLALAEVKPESILSTIGGGLKREMALLAPIRQAA